MITCNSSDTDEYEAMKKQFRRKQGETKLKPVSKYALEMAGVPVRPAHIGLEKEQSMKEFFKTGA
jgi:hypothetical protein